MAWARIDDAFFNHPKVRKAGKDAVIFHMAALCHSNAFTTDGFIADAMLELIAIQAFQRKANGLADRLVECGLWDRIEGGYLIHDYLEYNYSKQQVEEIKSKRSAAGKQGGRPTKSKPKANEKQNESKIEANEKQNESHTHTHINTNKDLTTTTTTVLPSDFQPFAEVYELVTGSEPKVLNAEIEAVSEILKAGGTPDDFRSALQGMQDKDYTIANMSSALTWTLKDINKRKQPVRNNKGGRKSTSASLDEILADAPIFAEDK